MKVGIVGMPNAGKSSLFTALTGVAAEAANYPFTTIEPNVAIVPVADERLDVVARIVGASKIVPDTIAFHDIAGLVAGAHRGEGLGNKFLANIRETDAIVHVVRAHNDPNVVHPDGRVDPLADIETIETELIYADLEQAERRLERVSKTAKSGDRHAIAEAGWLRELIEALQHGRPARTVPPPAEAPDAVALLAPLSAKPVLFVANVDEGSDEVPPAVAEHAAAEGAKAVAVSSRLEAELAELDDEDGAAMRADLGLEESSLQTVVRGAFALLDLIAFFTAGEDKPAQSWHLRRGLSVWHAAGLIHSDIQRGFVRAEVVSLGPVARRGRLRGSPRSGHVAPRRARLPSRRRRRDHGQVHALTGEVWDLVGAIAPTRSHTPYRSASESALSSRSARRSMLSARAAWAPPSRSVGRSAGRSSSTWRRVAIARYARSSSACSRSAAATRGRSPSAAAIAPSSEPWASSSAAAVLAPIPGAPGSPSEGSPRSAMKSGTSSGPIP